ncbi:MAG: hypothetical protein ACE5FN_04430 [Leptospirillia bacterium]
MTTSNNFGRFRASHLGWCLAFLLSACGGGGGGGVTNVCSGYGAGMGAGAFTISGTVNYEDKPFNSLGLTGASTTLPVRKASVEVIRCSDGAVLGSADTDNAGNYSISASNTGTAGVYVRVLAKVSQPGYSLSVIDAASAIHSQPTTGFDETGGASVNITAPASSSGGPFNILDTALSGIEYVDGNTTLPTLTALKLLWDACPAPFTALSCGTVFYPNGIPPFSGQKLITLVNVPGTDTDDYDDMVIMHEVGHYIANQLSEDDSPGGSHSPTDTHQDARLAWSEGWGGYFASAATGIVDYLDTDGSSIGTAGRLLGVNLETRNVTSGATPLGAWGNGADTEISVSAALWDAIDNTPGDEPSNLADADVLSAFEALQGTVPPVTFGRFTNALREDATLAGTPLADFTTAMPKSLIDVVADDQSDNVAAGATAVVVGVSAAAANLVYDREAGDTEDVDYYSVPLTNGTTYTVQTSLLQEGADPYISVRDASDADLTPLQENDNGTNPIYSASCTTDCPPNSGALAASLTFTAPSTATYLIRVERSPDAPPSAGLFGGYTLSVNY